MQYVYLLTTGTGEDGNEWSVESIHATLESAELHKKKYEMPRFRGDGSSYVLEANIEKWEVKEEANNAILPHLPPQGETIARRAGQD